MRRKDREIVDESAIQALMEEAQVCRIGLSDNGMPYVVPMNFGLGKHCLYLHSAQEGRKIDILRKNAQVCFEMDILHEIKRESLPCSCTARFDSVIGFGRAVIVEEADEKRLALDRIMEHCGAEGPFVYGEKVFARTAIIRIDIKSVAGKHHE